jgi:hypothetical protein
LEELTFGFQNSKVASIKANVGTRNQKGLFIKGNLAIMLGNGASVEKAVPTRLKRWIVGW